MLLALSGTKSQHDFSQYLLKWEAWYTDITCAVCVQTGVTLDLLMTSFAFSYLELILVSILEPRSHHYFFLLERC